MSLGHREPQALGLRPNYHQLEERVDGHVFISVLADHLLSWIRVQFESSGDTRDWRTIWRILRAHSITTTSLALIDGRIIHIRKSSVPDAEQALIYKILGIDWKSAFKTKKTELPA